jgi:Cdc6-like AAA superfamily ATPase
LAKWLASSPGILILNGPTVGVDIGAKAGIHGIIRDLARRGVGLIVISRGTEYYGLLEKSELSTLGRSIVDFKPYTSEQIQDILSSRAKEAFKMDTVPDSVIEFIADVTSAPPVNGDVRYALDLLLFAGT